MKTVFVNSPFGEVQLSPAQMDQQVYLYELTKVGDVTARRRRFRRKFEANFMGDIHVYERGWRTCWLWVLARRVVDGQVIEHRKSLLGQV